MSVVHAMWVIPSQIHIVLSQADNLLFKILVQLQHCSQLIGPGSRHIISCTSIIMQCCNACFLCVRLAFICMEQPS